MEVVGVFSRVHHQQYYLVVKSIGRHTNSRTRLLLLAPLAGALALALLSAGHASSGV